MEKKTENNIDILYNKYAHSLFSYALSLGFDRETAMDAIHDIFCKLCAKERLFDSIDNIRFYLFRSLKNRLLDIHKQTKTFSKFARTSADLPFTINISIEDELIEFEDGEQVKRKISKMLEKLTNRQREIIYLRYTQECSYEEISGLMNITIPACRKLMHKSLSKLRESQLSVIILLSAISC